MSVTTWAYGVDLQQLEQALGSHDEALLNAVARKIDPDPFESPGDVSVRDGLEALIRGQRYDSYVGRAKQLYALERLCDHLGKRLAGQGAIAYLDDLEWETQLLESGPPFSLSRADDFPAVCHLTSEQVRDECARLAALDTVHDDPDVTEAREELVGWLQQCVGSGWGLITFQY